jgi:hypothetical protein
MDRTFQFSGQDSSGTPVRELTRPGLSGLCRIIPIDSGERLDSVVFVNEYLDFPGAGVYTVGYSGSILWGEEPLPDQDKPIRVIGLSGDLTAKLCQASSSDLERVLGEYAQQLKSPDDRLQAQAARALALSEPSVAVKLLTEALEGENGAYPTCASRATWALAKIGTQAAIQALLDVAVHSKHSMVRTDAIMELGRWHINRAAPTLTGLLSDPSPGIREIALRSLGYIGDKSYTQEVESAFNDPDEKVRKTAREVYKLLTEPKADARRDRMD